MRVKGAFVYRAKVLLLTFVMCCILYLLMNHDVSVQPLGLKALHTNLNTPNPHTTHLNNEGRWNRVVKDTDVVCSAFELPMVPKKERRLIHEPLNCTEVLAKKLPAWVSIRNGVAVVDINVKHNRTKAVCMFWGWLLKCAACSRFADQDQILFVEYHMLLHAMLF
jgi:hypothetical protein